MELKEGQKYKVIVGGSEGEFPHRFRKGTEVIYTGEYKDHHVVEMIYRFKSKIRRNWLKKEWVVPVENNIKKLR